MINDANMIHAPVLIPTLCRDDHFIRCIESLRHNTWAKYTDIYIALDYPQKESHWAGYKRICSYLEGDFPDFKSFNVIKRPTNYGSVRNMKELRNFVFESYDRFIRADDDLEFAPNFLEYMNTCLTYYEKDKDVIAVTGYSYPVEWVTQNNENVVLSNFICPMWGTGFWKEKYRELEKDIEDGFLRKEAKKHLKFWDNSRFTDARFLDYANGVLSWTEKNLLDIVSDVSLGIYLGVKDKTVVQSRQSKVRNFGFDGTGEYCQNIIPGGEEDPFVDANNYKYSQQAIDIANSFHLVPAIEKEFQENKKIMNNFDRRPKDLVIKAKLKIFLYQVIGNTAYKKMWLKKNNGKLEYQNGV